MKPPSKIALVGAGGISCHLLPILSFEADIVLIDGDTYEPENSSRQFPALYGSSHGANKAEYLTELQATQTTHDITPLSCYMEGSSIVNYPEFQGVEMIIGAVDNNQSRKIICDVADLLDIPAILAGNETNMGDAHLFLPGIYDPFEHHDFGPMTKAPFSCTSTEQLEKEPQTTQANFLAASCAVHILMSWRTVSDPKYVTVYSNLDGRSCSRSSRMPDPRINVVMIPEVDETIQNYLRDNLKRAAPAGSCVDTSTEI